MTKYVGRVSQSDLEGGGHWVLTTEQGVTFQLKGGGADLLVDGVRAEVEGRLATRQLGIAMLGDILEVKRYRLLG